jgi:hypothetical protein
VPFAEVEPGEQKSGGLPWTIKCQMMTRPTEEFGSHQPIDVIETPDPIEGGQWTQRALGQVLGHSRDPVWVWKKEPAQVVKHHSNK